jgi:hypothetical protein
LWSKGFGADEMKAALTRVQQLASSGGNAIERFVANYGLWAGNIACGEFRFAREIAETFLREAEREERTTRLALAHQPACPERVKMRPTGLSGMSPLIPQLQT